MILTKFFKFRWTFLWIEWEKSIPEQTIRSRKVNMMNENKLHNTSENKRSQRCSHSSSLSTEWVYESWIFSWFVLVLIERLRIMQAFKFPRAPALQGIGNVLPRRLSVCGQDHNVKRVKYPKLKLSSLGEWWCKGILPLYKSESSPDFELVWLLSWCEQKTIERIFKVV